MPPRTDPRAGFMLVEVLAALAVTAALVAVVLPFAGRLVGRWQAGQASVVEADAWMRAVARLTDDVAEALPVHDPDADGQGLAFTVGPQRIELIRPALGRPQAGLERVSYQVEGGTAGARLVRRAQPLRTGEGGSSVTMFEGPYTFRFWATGKDGLRANRWASADAMPVRLELTASTAGNRRAPFSPLALPLAARANMAAVVPLLRKTSP